MDDKKDLQQEQNRVNHIITKIAEQKQKTTQLFENAHQETKQVEKNYSQNAKVNLMEEDDRMETHASIQQQKGLVARAVENETIFKRQIHDLNELEKSPYFGRIDIQDAPQDEVESLYIGVSSLADEDGNFLIYDWRAPISSIYYNGTLGKVKYETPVGQMETDLLKKRQFNISHGEIVHMFDTNETVGDELLQEALGEQNDEYMRNIVATIQKEQNDIIRDIHSDLLVVQGVAGSGKTSAILQRIAFLLYHSRTSLNADEIVLFSPNKLYSRYISDVLPSLGERNMRQLTLAEFFNRRLEGLRVQSLFNRFENPALTSEDQKIVNFKESQLFIDQLLKYEINLTPDKLKFTNINYHGTVFFTKEEISEIFQSFPASMSNKERLLKTKNELIKMLQKRTKTEIQSDWVQEQINEISDEKYRDLVGRRHFQSYDEENNFIGQKIVSKKFEIIDDAIFNNYFIDIYAQYTDFMQSLSVLGGIDWQMAGIKFQQQLELHKIKLEDAAPLLFLRDLITGSGTNRKFQYVFVDEMQDYSVAQLMYLKHAFPRAKFTLLGDSEQTLFKDVISPEELLNRLKSALLAKKANLITLNRSYRSTKQITNFAAALLPDGDKIQPFSREGQLPNVVISNDQVSAIDDIKELCNKQLAKYGTVAILTKNMVESEKLNEQFHDIHPHLLSDGDRSLPKGILILPIYLAKGLEFDSVIAYDVSQNNYPNDKWRGTLYTIASRAMHELNIISIGDLSPLITQINPKYFSFQKSFNFN